jgi:PPK2 family polyphosphate:nucleotide phosphotransferase
MKISSPFVIKPHQKVRLSRERTSAPSHFPDKTQSDAVLAKHRAQLEALQEVFYASQQKALLIVLQGIDTAGKDGAIRHIFSGINPQGCDVASFKTPTPVELAHDFLWRVHAQVPQRGMIGIFNRSHYEDVLLPHVHKLIDRKTVHARLDDINEFESSLADSNIVILKFFLHISKDEQARRLQARLDDKNKQWKISDADFKERAYWKQYREAYETILSKTSQAHAPWFVIPSDNKTYRNVAISEILVEVLQGLKLKYPKPHFDPKVAKL